jgi:ATP-dependent helicase HepA
MIGYLVRHEEHGEGRITEIQARTVMVRFFHSESSLPFGRDSLQQGFLRRVLLEPGRRCEAARGPCAVRRVVLLQQDRPYEYEIQGDDGENAIVPETSLHPLPNLEISNCAARVANRDFDNVICFRSREALCGAQLQNLRQGGRLKALLSSRIDLRPHQAFVAGTIISDRRKRYILADEVGLGKTIEAGVVLHDLISGKPDARVLVLCPGTLVQQWLCEIYSKFGGQVFTLLDLHSGSDIQWSRLARAIVSTSRLMNGLDEELERVPWDLLIVDECHHLLATSTLYHFVQCVARRTPSVLLLSAIPAQRREDEFLRLLALLEPDRYNPDDPESVEQFQKLYEAQPAIGRRLKPLSIRLAGLDSGEFTQEDVAEQVRRLASLPILANDTKLRALVTEMEGDPDRIVATARRAIDLVTERYRVHRRILRNRRQQLVHDGQMEPVQRMCELHGYPPGQLEMDAIASIHHLLSAAWRKKEGAEELRAFARIAFQSLASSRSALDLFSAIPQDMSERLNEKGRDFINMGHLTGYSEWSMYCELLLIAAGPLLDRDLLAETIDYLILWNRSQERDARFHKLVAVIREIKRRERGAKVLIFAGYPGLAANLALGLRAEFGHEAITEFRADLSREEKEENVRRFADGRELQILVSDETGGEGRNFQFASELVHYDHPWHVSRVEQRIGRLDRFGRAAVRGEVLSHVVFAAETVEEGLVACYRDGLGVYLESISGLEFSLRERERELAEAAIREGLDGLRERIPSLRQSAEEERAKDENEALLDLASFNEDRARQFLSVRSQPEIESRLEAAFVEYFHWLSTEKGMVKYADSRTPADLWRLDLDKIRFGDILKLSTDAASKVVGTFRRDVAQRRLDVQFFQLGNPVFDAVASAASFHSMGRTYAVQCRHPGSTPWSGFEFVFSALPNVAVLACRLDLVDQVDWLFWVAPVHIFVRPDGTLEPGMDGLRRVRQSLAKSNKGRVWVDLRKEPTTVFDTVYSADEWPMQISQLAAAARGQAQTQLRERLEPQLRDRRNTWSNLVQQARKKGTRAALQEAESLELMLRAINEWTVHLNGAGFLAVNQNLVDLS